MKNHLRQLVILFLTGFALLGQSCVEEELPKEILPSVWETENWAARRLLRQLQEQPAASEEFLTALSGEKVFYSEIRLIGMPEYGLCYFIPYGSDKIEGALFYPLDSEMREDGTYLLEGTLNPPDNIDARRLNEDIPITKRFLYSAQFKELQEQGLEVLPALVACAEALDGKSVPISEEESSFPPGTRASGGFVNIELQFSNTYYSSVNPNGDVDVFGLSPNDLEAITQQAIRMIEPRLYIWPEYVSYSRVRFSILEQDMPCNPTIFCETLIRLIKDRLFDSGYSIWIGYECNYNHTAWSHPGGSTGSVGGSGGTGGSSGGSNNSGETSMSVVNALYADNSTLTLNQKRKLNKALQDFINECPQYKDMFENLIKRSKIKFEINPHELNKSHAYAGYIDKVLMFYDEDCIQLKYLREELIHAVQDIEFYGMADMKKARKNVEFEAKVIQDIVGLTITEEGMGMAFMNADETINEQYRDWIIDDFGNMPKFVSRFNLFCEIWTNYEGSYKSDFIPKAIKKYFNK